MDRHEEIRKMAYELYERSGMIPGRDFENWIKAEKIINERYAELKKTVPDAPPMKKAVTKTAAAKAERTKTEPVKAAPKKAGPRKK